MKAFLGAKYLILKRWDAAVVSTNQKFYLDKEAHSYEVAKVILATGAAYRKLELPGSAELEGKRIYYKADYSILEDVNQIRPHIYIYGAGNSAGQAALF